MNRFTFTPTKPSKGSNYLVCFEFTGLDDTYATVEVTHDPAQPDDPQYFVISRSGDSGCVTRQAPIGAVAAVYSEPNSDDAPVFFS